MLQLSKKWVEYLQSQPETGMGYHDTDMDLDNGDRLFGVIVYNCEWADISDPDVTEPMIKHIEVYGKGDRDISIRL